MTGKRALRKALCNTQRISLTSFCKCGLTGHLLVSVLHSTVVSRLPLRPSVPGRGIQQTRTSTVEELRRAVIEIYKLISSIWRAFGRDRAPNRLHSCQRHVCWSQRPEAAGAPCISFCHSICRFFRRLGPSGRPPHLSQQASYGRHPECSSRGRTPGHGSPRSETHPAAAVGPPPDQGRCSPGTCPSALHCEALVRSALPIRCVCTHIECMNHRQERCPGLGSVLP